jgi:hypothetical protein
MDDRLKAARAQVRVRIEAGRDNGFADQYVAYRLAHALTHLGYGTVAVHLVGGDEREAEARRSRMTPTEETEPKWQTSSD